MNSGSPKLELQVQIHAFHQVQSVCMVHLCDIRRHVVSLQRQQLFAVEGQQSKHPKQL